MIAVPGQRRHHVHGAATVDELALLPGPDALVAPPWVPWSERLAPGDLGVGDVLPTDGRAGQLERRKLEIG